MKNTFVKGLIVAIVLALLATAHSACGGGYSSPTAPATAPGQPTPTPRAGGGGY